MPRVLAITAAVALVFNVIMMFAGGLTTGVNTDMPTHLLRLQSYFDTGWYLPGWELNGAAPRPGAANTYVYGPLPALLAHGVAVLVGEGGWSHVVPRVNTYEAITASAEAYAAWNFTVGIFAVLGLFAVAALTRLALGSWRWGLLGAAFLSAFPLWSGYAMFDIKDVPVASGYALVTLGLASLCQPGALTSRRGMLVGTTALISGSTISMGTRPGMWPIIASSVGIALVVSVSQQHYRHAALGDAVRITVLRGTVMFFSLLTSYAILLGLYPAVFSTPLRAAWLSAKASADYTTVDPLTLTAGVLHGQPPPWWYLPAWFGNQVPLLVLLLGLAGLVSIFIALAHSLRGKLPENLDPGGLICLCLVTSQVLLAPLATFVLHARLYTGLRQLLFITPAWSVLAVVGLWLLAGSASRRTFWRGPMLLATYGIGAAALVMPTIDQARLFPYAYTYFNEVATLAPVEGRWATDYYKTSLRELAPKMGATGTVDCLASIQGNEAVAPYLPFRSPPVAHCGSPELSPYWDSRGQRSSVAPLSDSQFWLVSTNSFGMRLPKNCALTDAVERPLRGQILTMSWAALCQVVIPEYPAGGVSFVGKTSGQYLFDGWSPPEDLGSWSMGPRSTMGLLLPAALRDHDLELTLTGSSLVPPGETRTMRVFVNDHFVGEHTFSDRFRSMPVTVSVPSALARSSGGGRLNIRLANPDPVTLKSLGRGTDSRPLGFFLNSLRITKSPPEKR